MQDKKKKEMQLSEYANSLIIDMKSVSNLLKPLSKNLYQNNNRALNEVLTGKQQDINHLIIKILAHTLQIAQYKALVSNILQILKKTILCLKTFPQYSISSPSFHQLQQILRSIVDILLAITNQNRQNQQISLRVLQVTFSLNDQCFVHYFNLSIVDRVFSICFQFCSGVSTVQTISISALSALIEVLFQFGNQKECFLVLTELLQYLFEGKKFVWVKGKDVKGLGWDLIVIAIKNFSPNHIIGLQNQPQCLKLITKMYQITLQNIFLKKSKSFYIPSSPQKPGQKSQPTPTSDISDFIRHFKSYISLSTSLSIQSNRILQKQYIPFRNTIPKLGIVCDLQRNSRMFIFLQAICQLLLTQYDLPLALEKGIIFMEVLSKVSEELCWCNEVGVKVNWDHNQSYLHKVVNEEPKIGDGDFVRLIKNTIFNLRMKYQKDEDLLSTKKNKVTDSSRSSVSLPQNLGTSKKWQSFIKNIVRIIRYLSSLNFITQQTEQDPTRKIILQLQYWFLLCPISKAKNMILQQLLITANVLNNRMQAIKVSQSVQIGSNILYGYYEDLDSTGLTIILKMMAGIKADWEEGKSFEELDQVYNLVNNIFNQEHLITTQQTFLMTIQALVQCTNSLIADIEQPKQKPIQSSPQSQHPIKRFHKMIDFLLFKLITVINNHLHFAAMQWNFITGFLITLCINKNTKIKQDGVKAIGALVTKLLKSQLGKELDDKKQRDILGLYQELAKSKMQKDIQLAIIQQLKGIMPRIRQQNALMDGFRIVKILSDSQSKNADVIANIHQLQQVLIKDCLYKITQLKYLKLIVDGIQIKVSQKNQQYRLINLLWAIADYFRKITPHENIGNQYIQLWELLFKNIWVICQTSRQLQTKQSAIHCTTQVLGQVIEHLPFDFVIVVIGKYYHEMVLLLLGIHSSSLGESQKSSQTAKVALKNYIKLFKKLTIINQKSPQDKRQITKNFSSINKSITKYIQSHVENKTIGSITLQLLFQLCNFILVVSEDVGFVEYNVKADLWNMLVVIEDFVRGCENGAIAETGKMDMKSHMYKKKLKPLMEKIREIHDKEKMEQVVVNNTDKQ